MLEFEEILRKYSISNDHDIKVVEALDIKECRELLDEKIKNVSNSISDVINIRKKAEEKQLLLLKESIAESITQRIYKMSKDQIDGILSDLETNELIVSESIKKIKHMFNSLEQIKKYYLEKEDNIGRQFEKQCKRISFERSEIEILMMYINSDEFKSIMEMK